MNINFELLTTVLICLIILLCTIWAVYAVYAEIKNRKRYEQRIADLERKIEIIKDSVNRGIIIDFNNN